MNLIVKKITYLLIIVFLYGGCGESVKNARDAISNINDDSTFNQNPYENQNTHTQNPNQIECQDFLRYEQENNNIYIINPKSPCKPYVNLYHAEVQPTWSEYIYDDDLDGYALKFHSNGLKNAIHILGYRAKNMYQWSDFPHYQNKFNISWDSKMGGDYMIFLVIQFQNKDGSIEQKDLVYLPIDSKEDLNNRPYENFEITKEFLPIFLGSDIKDGKWHHFQRNILDDLHRYRPSANIDFDDDKNRYLNGFALRGSGMVSNIKISK